MILFTISIGYSIDLRFFKKKMIEIFGMTGNRDCMINNSNSKPKVSIIIPVYNAEIFLPKCLQSLIDQSLEEIEIIAVDDGSTDNSYQILLEYAQKDTRIKVFRQKNLKQGAARNQGIAVSNGEYIGFVDADDWIDKDYFEKLYITSINNNADIAVASILKHKQRYNKYSVFYSKVKTADTMNEKLKICFDKKQKFFYCWNKLCKASVIKNNNITFPENIVYEDALFALKILFHANRVVSVPNIKYHYVENLNSTINLKGNAKKNQIYHEISATEFIEYAKKNNIKIPERFNYIRRYWKFGIFKIFEGTYKNKISLFGHIPIWISKKQGYNL